MHDYLEVFVCVLYPSLGQTLALVIRKHVPLARRAVDKPALQAILLQHLRIGGNGLIVYLAIRIERGKRSIYQSLYLFHIAINICYRFYV